MPPPSRLATYGTLGPGRPNHHQLVPLGGTWATGTVHGLVLDSAVVAGADTNADVRALVDAQGYCLFRLGGTFEDVAAECAALTEGD